MARHFRSKLFDTIAGTRGDLAAIRAHVEALIEHMGEEHSLVGERREDLALLDIADELDRRLPEAYEIAPTWRQYSRGELVIRLACPHGVLPEFRATVEITSHGIYNRKRKVRVESSAEEHDRPRDYGKDARAIEELVRVAPAEVPDLRPWAELVRAMDAAAKTEDDGGARISDAVDRRRAAQYACFEGENEDGSIDTESFGSIIRMARRKGVADGLFGAEHVAEWVAADEAVDEAVLAYRPLKSALDEAAKAVDEEARRVVRAWPVKRTFSYLTSTMQDRRRRGARQV